MPAPKGHEPYEGCETGGRPEKYTEEFIEREADAFLNWIGSNRNIYFKSFALERGYHPNRLAEFANQNEKFLGAYEKAKAWQEIRLIEGGLLSEFNAGFTKFVMINVCGWTDKQETKVSVDKANPLRFILEQINGKTKDLIEER